jgi:hypothetical protein
MSNYNYHGTRDLIAMPGRSVQTFPSGLVRVERSFMCRKDDAARYRNILRVNEPMPFDDGAPAFDGLFIFPDPQEQVRDDGFAEFRVTAYGRTNATGSQSINITRGEFSADLNVALSQITVLRCLPTFSALNDFVDPPKVKLEFAWSVKIEIPLQRIIDIPQGAVLTVNQQLESVLNNSSYVAPFGGFILEKRTAGNLSTFQTAYLYAAPADLPYTEFGGSIRRTVISMIQNQSTNFGYFTEFISTYGYLGVPIIAAGNALQFNINGAGV